MKKARFISGAIFFGIGFFVLITFVTMYLWNWLMPELFSLGVIDFWKAAGILVLSKILFSNMGHGHNWHSDRKKKYWHSSFKEKWEKVPHEKKEEFIHKMEEKGFHKNSEDSKLD